MHVRVHVRMCAYVHVHEGVCALSVSAIEKMGCLGFRVTVREPRAHVCKRMHTHRVHAVRAYCRQLPVIDTRHTVYTGHTVCVGTPSYQV